MQVILANDIIYTWEYVPCVLLVSSPQYHFFTTEDRCFCNVCTAFPVRGCCWAITPTFLWPALPTWFYLCHLIDGVYHWTDADVKILAILLSLPINEPNIPFGSLGADKQKKTLSILVRTSFTVIQCHGLGENELPPACLPCFWRQSGRARFVEQVALNRRYHANKSFFGSRPEKWKRTILLPRCITY
jgi:hypothetical protein